MTALPAPLACFPVGGRAASSAERGGGGWSSPAAASTAATPAAPPERSLASITLDIYDITVSPE